MGDLLHAIMVVASAPASSIADLLLGLRHPAVIAEQAAFALYRRTGRPKPANASELSMDAEDWVVWLLTNANGDPRERMRCMLAATAATASRVRPDVAAKLAEALEQAAN
jgi:hypothetical protein